MKKLLFILIASLALSTCSKEETPQEQIVGTWELQYYYIDKDNNPVDLSKAESYEKIDNPHCAYITFNKDKNCGLIEMTCYCEYSDAGHYSCTYSINDNTIYKNTEGCDWQWSISTPDTYIYAIAIVNSPISYKIESGMLILGFNLDHCTYYGYYTRK